MSDRSTSAGEQDTPPPRLLVSLQSLLSTLLAMVHTRVDIVATELEEERARLRDMVILGLLALVFLCFGIVLLTFFIVMVFWDSYGVYVLGAFAVLYLGMGATAAASLRRRTRTRPRLFSTTLAELAKDQAGLKSP